MLLALILTGVLIGCATVRSSDPATLQIELRIATQIMARQVRLNKPGIVKVLDHLNMLEETLPRAVPPNFDMARTRIEADTSEDERLVLLVIIDLAEKYAMKCLENRENGSSRSSPKECRATVELCRWVPKKACC
jgi:hypothetical protein